MRFSLLTSLVAIATLAVSVMGASVPVAREEAELAKRDTTKYVFAHFIVSPIGRPFA